MRYKCERCGANLDPGETCDCTEKEPPRGNVNGSDGDIANTPSSIIACSSPVVNSFEEPIRALRVYLGLTQEECAAYIRKKCPKFDVILQSKCENSRQYGVTYTRQVMEMVMAKLPPDTQEAIRYARGGRHKMEKRISGRLPDDVYDAFLDAIHGDGYDTVQDWITHTVSEYMRRRET